MARSILEQAVVRRLIPNDAKVWRVQRLAQHVGRFSAHGDHHALLADMVIVECKGVRMADQVSTVNDRLPKIFTSVLERQLKCADAAGGEVCETDPYNSLCHSLGLIRKLGHTVLKNVTTLTLRCNMVIRGSIDDVSVVGSQAVTCTYNDPPDPSPSQVESTGHPDPEWSLARTSAASHPNATAPSSRHVKSAPIRDPTLQASQNQGSWGLLSDQAATQMFSHERPAIRSDTLALLEPEQPQKKENVIFRGKNFKTQYYGGSNPATLIGDFPELRSFMRDGIKQYPSLPRVQRELKSLQMKWKVEKASAFVSVNMEFLHVFPKQEIADQLIHIYFDIVETTYRIVHIPSFWEEYKSFREDNYSARPAFLVLMLLMMSTASCLSEENVTYVGDSAVARERAAIWIEISERWLRIQSQKRIYLTIWQIQCLLVLSKQVNVIKKKRIWTEAGILHRQAMAAGFHRDPALFGEKELAFDQEMRRRLWATITELELQASIDRGMPSASASIFSDCASVLNIDDADLTDEGDNESGAKDWNEFSTSSFLHVSRSSFALRVTLNSVVNDLASPLQWEQIVSHEEMVSNELQKLPTWIQSGTHNYAEVLPAALAQIQLQQFLILLHTPFAKKRNSDSRCSVSRMICFQAATKILEQVQQLSRHNYLFVILFRHEYFRAALVVCHNAFVSYNVPGDLFGANITSFIRYLEDALTLFEDRITRLGTDFTRHWYISAARSLLRSVVDPSDATTQEQQAIEHVARQYYRVRASQEDMHSAKEKLNLTESPAQNSSNMATIPDLPFHNGTMAPIDFPLEALEEEFFFGDPAAWTFDNFEVM
ncbi:uncharacterized protein N7498_007739 [Penicillium cinerascens]|uniref:Xylanolytic transcriptional activator regulatory domain-containing protein n=1 Tax=Penicillium cinerascens TaxID=70096 RepID=A0A9W9MFK1_9EURO|nr:uncharacterized protein N7498_007739 [Penicillium cinerascens]KAJ5198622.1 hypothetical protein N7498_007739 [Penicillium cinerascens]